jgi:hypothetical protein
VTGSAGIIGLQTALTLLEAGVSGWDAEIFKAWLDYAAKYPAKESGIEVRK